MSIFHKIFLLLYFVFQGLLTSKMIFIYFFIFFIYFSENALEERGEHGKQTINFFRPNATIMGGVRLFCRLGIWPLFGCRFGDLDPNFL